MNPMMKPPAGGHSPSTGQMGAHLGASHMAFAAGRRAQVRRALSGGNAGGNPAGGAQPVQGGPPPTSDYRAHISHALSLTGHSVGPAAIHQAIAGLTKAGQFTPVQGNALVQHRGPLVGQAGQNTIKKITSALTAQSGADAAVPGGSLAPPPMGGGGPGGPAVPGMGAM